MIKLKHVLMAAGAAAVAVPALAYAKKRLAKPASRARAAIKKMETSARSEAKRLKAKPRSKPHGRPASSSGRAAHAR